MKKSIILITSALLFTAAFFVSCASTPAATETEENTQEEIVTIIDNSESETSKSTEATEENIPDIDEPTVYDVSAPDEQEANTPAPQTEETEIIEEDDSVVLEKLEDGEGFFISEDAVLIPVVSAEPETEETEPAELNDSDSEVSADISSDTNGEVTEAENSDEKLQEASNIVETATAETVPVTAAKTENKSEIPVVSKEIAKTEIKAETKPVIETSPLYSKDIEAPETSEPEESEVTSLVNNEVIKPSRSASMKNNQYIDVVYPGTGWIYLGETDNNNLMRYFGRKLGDSDTTFTFRSIEEGTTILHFYKNDPLTDSFIDDYLAITVEGKNTTSQRVTAPSYASVVPERFQNFEDTQSVVAAKKEEAKQASVSVEEQKESTPTAVESVAKTEPDTPVTGKGKVTAPATEDDSKVSTVVQNTETTKTSSTQDKIPESKNTSRESTAVTEDSKTSKSAIGETNNSGYSQDDLLQLATDCYNTKNYQQALKYLDQFFKIAVSHIDEGLFLKGQILETNSSVRNIKASLEAYEALVKTYPQSKYWQQANERIIYIKRFYFNKR